MIKGSPFSAGVDLVSCESICLHPQQFKLVDVGLRVAEIVPKLRLSSDFWFGLIKDRSSLAMKGLRVGAGVIDQDYEGPIKVLLMNHGWEPFEIEVGDRIAQLIIIPYVPIDIEPVISNRGSGGFGSTG